METVKTTLMNWGSGIAAAIGAVVSKLLDFFKWANCTDAELIKKLTIILLFCQLIHIGYRVLLWGWRIVGGSRT